MPGFWVAIMLILVFAVNLHVLPVSGADTWKNLVLPAATLTLLTSAKIIPLIRSNMIEVMQQDYIRTARSKGLRGGKMCIRDRAPSRPSRAKTARAAASISGT